MQKDNALTILETAVAAALKYGCDAAEAVFVEGDGISASVRLGKLEHVERPAEAGLGLRVYAGKRAASLSTSDLSEKALKTIAEKAASIAKLTPEDPYAGLSDSNKPFGDAAGLEIYDDAAPDADALQALALRAEDAARAVKGITNSEGGAAAWRKSTRTHITSKGFEGRYASSYYSISAVAIAGEGRAMERDYEFAAARHLADLEAPEKIGKEAAERTLKRLGPKKIKSQTMPVIFEKRAASTLIGHFAGAINGKQVAKGTTFLAKDMGKKIFATGVRIIDDPNKKRGLASKPFDGEGVLAETLALIDDGVLKSWLLDCASAREMRLKTNGRATRALAGTPSPGTTNLYMENGTASLEDFLKDAGTAFLVTELIGMGVNPVTGDYSRGASGFLVENGKIVHPVNEVTIAGNLKDIFASLIPASDLEFKGAVNAPSVLVPSMTVAGT